jgi:hypothetical protein
MMERVVLGRGKKIYDLAGQVLHDSDPEVPVHDEVRRPAGVACRREVAMFAELLP